jgi:hypothetical protein
MNGGVVVDYVINHSRLYCIVLYCTSTVKQLALERVEYRSPSTTMGCEGILLYVCFLVDR